MSNNTIVMLDTNVLLDYYLPTRPSSKASMSVISLCGRKEMPIVYPLHALHDVFWQVQRDAKAWVSKAFDSLPERYAKAAKAEAWGCVEHMLSLGAPVAADITDARRAIELRAAHSDFEDNMVLAAAERAHVDYLVTSDRRLIEKATVAAFTPEDMAALLSTSI